MNTLKAILNDLGIPEDLLHQSSLLHKDLQIDSTETVEISLALKRKLGINMKLETRTDKTLIEVCQMIEAAMSAKSPGDP
ncbi:MAG: acyl carrier protein [Nodularia sp. (in: Bacteria)]|nr:MAG: acyl carrier protein [Nodularia sp. (in: cyanobacteria)]